VTAKEERQRIIDWLGDKIESIDSSGQSDYDAGLNSACGQFQDLLYRVMAGAHWDDA
jgi:hypothetical protein